MLLALFKFVSVLAAIRETLFATSSFFPYGNKQGIDVDSWIMDFSWVAWLISMTISSSSIWIVFSSSSGLPVSGCYIGNEC